jgi:hypothetical protein
MVKLYQFLKVHGVLIGFSVGGVLSVLSFLVIIMGLEKNLTNKEMYDVSAFDFGLFVNYILLFVSVIVAAVFPIIYLAKNFKESIKMLIGMGVVILIGIVAYVMASGTITPDIAKGAAQMKMTEGNVKLTETFLYLGYWLFFASLGAVVFSVVRPLFAKH